jgi:hypothetical protein
MQRRANTQRRKEPDNGRRKQGGNGQVESLTAADLAFILETHRDALLAEWADRVLVDPGLPAAPALSRPAPYDHLPAILDRLVVTLQALADHPEELGRLMGATEEAKAHVRDRIAAAYSVPEVLRELSHLRLTIMDFFSATQPNRDAAVLLHAAFDQMMINAAHELCSPVVWGYTECPLTP